MEVILQQDIKSLGKKGQKIKVSDGYAQNFLLPKKLAVPANAANLNTLKTQNDAAEYRRATEKAAALEQKAAVDGMHVQLKAKAGMNGKLFGAVTAKEVADAIKETKGIEIDKKKIRLPGADAIKAFGTYSAEIKLYPDIAAQITITVAEE